MPRAESILRTLATGTETAWSWTRSQYIESTRPANSYASSPTSSVPMGLPFLRIRKRSTSWITTPAEEVHGRYTPTFCVRTARLVLGECCTTLGRVEVATACVWTATATLTSRRD